MNKLVSLKRNQPVNLFRAGKAIIRGTNFDTDVEVRKQGRNFIVAIDGKKRYDAANTAQEAWAWLCEYLYIKV